MAQPLLSKTLTDSRRKSFQNISSTTTLVVLCARYVRWKLGVFVSHAYNTLSLTLVVVAQLNFYGFRKIKSDPLRLKDAETSEESKWWKFRHEKFVQGRPDYLLQIKKHSNTSSDGGEVEVLKAQVRELKAKLNNTVDEVGELKAMVQAMKKENDLKRSPPVYIPLPAGKKRRTSLTTGAEWASSEELVPVPVPSESPVPSAFVDSPTVDDEMLAYISAFDTTDGTMNNDIFASMPDLPLSSVPDEEKEQAQKLEDAFAKIPPALRALFVDRLVALVSDPDEFKKQADAATQLALAAAAEATTQSDADTDASVRLGAAILGAYLSRLGGSSKTAS